MDTYLAYCQEDGFEPLSKSTLYKILSECPASKRTNLKGLDNIAAEGNSSFETLIGIIQELEKSNITQTAALLECKEKFQSSKLYLKTEYKLNIQKESGCADHCLSYALSDESNSNLNQTCSHEHQIQCEKCSNLNIAIMQLKELISGNNGLFYIFLWSLDNNSNASCCICWIYMLKVDKKNSSNGLHQI